VAAQVVMGTAMGPLFPASMQLLAKWVPPSRRTFASTVLDTGVTVGSMVAVPISGLLAMSLGWRLALLIYGLAAVAYSAIWARYAAEQPESTDEEQGVRVSTASHSTKEAAAGSGSFLDCLQYVRLWAIYVSHFTFNYSVYFVNSWSATYYLEVFGIRPEHAGLHLSIPHAVNMLVKVFLSPLLTRKLQARGCSELVCRRVFSGLGFLGPAVFLRLLPRCAGANSTTACFCAILGFLALHPCGFKANYMDVTTTRGGIVSGIGNTLAGIAGSVGPLMVSQLRASTGSWVPIFALASTLNVLAALVFCTLSSATPIEADADRSLEPAESQAAALAFAPDPRRPSGHIKRLVTRLARRRSRLTGAGSQLPAAMPGRCRVALVAAN